MEWPVLDDREHCRRWLGATWSQSWFADGVRHASPSLADQIQAIIAGDTTPASRVRSATIATARYVLRAISRPTPFGLFAGVAGVGLDRPIRVKWGSRHRAVARVDSGQIAELVNRLERDPEVLAYLDVTANDLVVGWAGWPELVTAEHQILVQRTAAIDWLLAAAKPVPCRRLMEEVAGAFPGSDLASISQMITDFWSPAYGRRSPKQILLGTSSISSGGLPRIVSRGLPASCPS